MCYIPEAKCGSSSVVERFLAKEEVAGSIPVSRSINLSASRADILFHRVISIDVSVGD